MACCCRPVCASDLTKLLFCFACVIKNALNIIIIFSYYATLNYNNVVIEKTLLRQIKLEKYLQMPKKSVNTSIQYIRGVVSRRDQTLGASAVCHDYKGR